MSWKVLITAPAMVKTGTAALELLQASRCIISCATESHSINADHLCELLRDQDAVIAALEPYSHSVLAAPQTTTLKLISRWGVGYDSVELPSATAAGILVTNTPAMLDEAVADYAFALLLALARRIPEGQQVLQTGRWPGVWGTDVAGKTLGLVGCGRIALAMARRGIGFNLRLLASDPQPSAAARQLGVTFASLDTVLAESDFISLHAALTPDSQGLIGEAQLRKMKRSALLVNVSRGALLDEQALVQALQENWIAGAALDVFSQEPLPRDHPFRTAPNLLLTPHQASFAHDTGARVSLAAAQTVLDVMNGQRPRFLLNPRVLASPNCRTIIHE